jgi:hypothetical protein
LEAVAVGTLKWLQKKTTRNRLVQRESARVHSPEEILRCSAPIRAAS